MSEEREIERERDRDKKREKERERVRVCVFIVKEEVTIFIIMHACITEMKSETNA